MLERLTRNAHPARYLPGFDARRIREIEIGTARRPGVVRERTSLKAEHLRDMGEAIGWDLGQDATLSFVECSGGEVARTFHGRPMHIGHAKAAIF